MNGTARCQIREKQQPARCTWQEFDDWREGEGDLTIQVHEASTKAHRAVLMKHSDYFKNMFSGRFSESGLEVLDLSHSFNDITELQWVLTYMYTGILQLTKDKIRSVSNTAALFLLGDLKTTCAEFLMTNIAPCTALNIFVLADTYTLTDVRSACLEVIKAWFPFNLCESKEALDMSPDCLKLLAQENIFALLPDDIKDSFLERWHQNFKARSKKRMALSKEVKDLLFLQKLQGTKLRKSTRLKTEPSKSRTAKLQSAKSWEQDAAPEEVSREADPKEDELEEVLLVYAVPSNSINHFVEVLAFSPNTKSWKSVLRHIFVNFPTREKSVKLVGITECKAYFVFRDPTFLNHPDDCVISVDLQNKEDSIIKHPQKVDRPRELFLHGNTLCAFAFDENAARDSAPEYDCFRYMYLAMFRNCHDTKCPNTCEGSCWDRVSNIKLMHMEVPRPITQNFRCKVVKGNIYVWVQTWKTDCPAQMEYYCISQKEESEAKWEVKQLCNLWSISHVNKMDFDFSIMCPISVDPKTSALKFTLTLRFGCGEDYSPRGGCHKEYIYTYDPAKVEWKEVKFRKVVYPEPTCIVGDTTDDPLRHEPGVSYLDIEVEDDDEDYLIHYDHKNGGYRSCTFGYHARSTSPYSTCIWKMEPGEDEFHLVTYLPRCFDVFQGFKTGEMSRDKFKDLPKATFEDFSEDIGHSTMTPILRSFKEPDRTVDYEEGLSFHNKYTFAWLWASLWQRSIKYQ